MPLAYDDFGAGDPEEPELAIGSRFILSKDALEHYGEQFRDQVFTIRSIADHYVSKQEFFDEQSLHYREHRGSPEFDPDSGGLYLYKGDFLGALYRWEMVPVYGVVTPKENTP